MQMIKINPYHLIFNIIKCINIDISTFYHFHAQSSLRKKSGEKYTRYFYKCE